MYETVAIQMELKKKNNKIWMLRGKSQITCPASYYSSNTGNLC